MHPRIAELVDHLDQRHADLRAAVDAIPDALRSERPAPDRWSVAEVLEHLRLVERRATTLFTTRLAEARAAGLGKDLDVAPLLPTMDMATLLDRGRRIEVVDAIRPTGTVAPAAAWAALDEARAALKNAVRTGDGLALGEVSEPHRIFGPLNLYQWIAFLGGHQGRHTAQVREIGTQLSARGGVATGTSATPPPAV